MHKVMSMLLNRSNCFRAIKQFFLYCVDVTYTYPYLHTWAPRVFLGSGEKGYLFSGISGALLIILGELGSKHILLGI